MKLILDKIFNQLRNPYKIFQKFYEFYFLFRYKLFYNENFYIKNQNILFKKNLLNRKIGLNKIMYIKKKYPFLNSPMSSEHQVIFSSLSIKKKFKKILEIGTFDGTNAFLLSELFPKSKITTIDLEDTSEEFAESYGRFNYNKRKMFCRKRNAILAKSKNIKFIQKNSLYLTFSKNKYDLIWVDGAHGNPIVTIDIINALRLLNKGGYVACDDIFINKNNEFKNFSSFSKKFSPWMFSSIDAYETLKNLRRVKLINFELFYKRICRQHNSIPGRRKYIALFQKNT